jgi:beta-aspartyl-peptidase (threonine type)
MSQFTLAVHGGAGVIERERLSAGMERDYRRALAEALEVGRGALGAGGSALDAVVASVVSMEDSPLFNAARGAVFTRDGYNELDACVMDGRELRAGAVTLVRRVRNPVRLARLVMERSPHQILGGRSAEEFARREGEALVEESYFFTERRWAAMQRLKQAAEGGSRVALSDEDRHGTVGAVALDGAGNLAAATSTGGRTFKMSGRIGDTPIPGAGNYANNATVAVSGTGDGEFFIRTTAAYSVSALIELAGLDVHTAAHRVIHASIGNLGGTGGLIALDRHGSIAMPFNTPGMYRGWLRGTEPMEVAIYG